jgi:hypothetical protein
VLVPPDLHFLPTDQYLRKQIACQDLVTLPFRPCSQTKCDHGILMSEVRAKIGTKRDARWLVLIGEAVDEQ